MRRPHGSVVIALLASKRSCLSPFEKFSTRTGKINELSEKPPPERERVCMFMCVHEEMGEGGPKNTLDRTSYQINLRWKKCKSCWLQQYENAMKSREIIDFTN